jgi:hypothetical protein
MQTRGNILWVLGLLLFLFAAFIYDPSVASHGGAYMPSRIVNADLQQRQLLLAIAGLTLFLGGIIVQALGEMGEAKTAKDGGKSSPVSPPKPTKSSPANAELLAQHGIRGGDDGAQI